MTEDEAKAYVRKTAPDAYQRLELFLALVLDENTRQNLIAPSTVEHIWARHVADSLQLRLLAPAQVGSWLDIGTGGGFPGLVIAMASTFKVTLVESRRRRAEFLQMCVDKLELGQCVFVCHAKVENLFGRYDVISARAVSSVDRLLSAAGHCATGGTRWILPRGAVQASDTASLAGRLFHVEHSLTNTASKILVLDEPPQ